MSIPRDMNNPGRRSTNHQRRFSRHLDPNDGQYYLGKVPVTKTELADKVDRMLKAHQRTKRIKIVYIKSGVGVSYGDVVNVINEVRKLGVDKIGLVADKKKGGGAAAAKP